MTAQPPSWSEGRNRRLGGTVGPIARLSRSLKTAGSLRGVIAAAIGGYWEMLQYEGNFCTVTASVISAAFWYFRDDETDIGAIGPTAS